MELEPHVLAALDDVASRFIVNLPDPHDATIDRLFFQIQQAHWFFVDYYVDNKALGIPHLSSGPFTQALFLHCPLLVRYREGYKELSAQFGSYMRRVPSCGMIMLDESLTRVVLVQPFKGKSWSFPRGKLNEGESYEDCAVREAFEETGFDARPYLQRARFQICEDNKKTISMFVAAGVPLDTPFATRTRKEIGDISWFDVSALDSGSKFWNVRPFLGQLHSWIASNRRGRPPRSVPPPAAAHPPPKSVAPVKPAVIVGDLLPPSLASGFSVGQLEAAEAIAAAAISSFDPVLVPPAPTRGAAAPARGRHSLGAIGPSAPSSSSGPSPAKPRHPTPIGHPSPSSRAVGPPPPDRGKNVVTFGGDVGSSWSVEEMFRVNEGLIGRKFTYDGNAQTFGEMASGVVRHRDLAGARPGVTAPPVSAPIRRGNYFEGFAFDSSAIMAALDAAL